MAQTYLHKNVYILTSAQALLMSASSMIVFIGGIIGAEIAPDPKWVTLPVASIIVGSALSSVPVALSMRKFGRKRMFLAIGIFTVFIGLVAAMSISIGSFYMVCASFALIGVGISSVNQFRFAAMESVTPEQAPKAASTVLLGGIAAAFIGPEIAVLGKNLFAVPFVGSFILLAVLFALGVLLLNLYQNTKMPEVQQSESTRSLGQIAGQPVFWVAVLSAMIGYAVMSFIMTATPVSMHVMDGHGLHHTKWVIQSHIVAMFLPSLITPAIIKRIGINKIIVVGIAIFALCIFIALLGHELVNYWVSLVLLGLGWNFLFIGGTALLPQSYRPQERFKVQALNDFMIFGTQAIAALSAGYVVFQFGWNVVLYAMMPALAIPLVALIVHRKKN